MHRYGWSTLISLLLGWGAAAQTAPVLFTVKEKPVTSEEFVRLYRKNHTQPADYTEAKVTEYIGLLINFGNRSLQFKRVMKSMAIKQS